MLRQILRMHRDPCRLEEGQRSETRQREQDWDVTGTMEGCVCVSESGVKEEGGGGGRRK